MEQVLEFIKKYKYPIIGGLIAVLICWIDLIDLLKFIIIVAIGIYLGFYVQKNKDKLKQKIKEFIDKI